MRNPLLILIALVGVLAGVALAADPPVGGSVPTVYQLEVRGALTEPVAAYLSDGIARAEADGVQAVVLLLDTPGGKDRAARLALQVLVSSKVPVIVVVPRGARVSSTGVYLLLGADLVLATSSARVGPSHPITLRDQTPGGADLFQLLSSPTQPTVRPLTGVAAIEESQLFAQSLSAQRGELAIAILVGQTIAGDRVRLSEEFAGNGAVLLAENDHIPTLLEGLSGRSFTRSGKQIVLHTASPTVGVISPAWYVLLGQWLADPWIALALLLLGMWGMVAEVLHPGTLMPALLGITALALSAFGMSGLPVDPLGVTFLMLGSLMILGEAKVAGPGYFGIPGACLFLYGSFHFIPARYADLRIAPLAVAVMGVMVLGIGFTTIRYIRGQLTQRVKLGGLEGLIGQIGDVRKVLDPEGTIYVRGEYWTAHVATGVVPAGAAIRVLSKVGSQLLVEPVVIETAGEAP